MSKPFDPYHKWLAIPPSEQPPNHYRLLALPLFEDDGDVIASAADQRMAHVRTYQLGQYSEVSQKILNELAAARVCLLNPETKAAYDAQLREQQFQSFVERPRTSRTTPSRTVSASIAAAVVLLCAIGVVFLLPSGKSEQGAGTNNDERLVSQPKGVALSSLPRKPKSPGSKPEPTGRTAPVGTARTPSPNAPAVPKPRQNPSEAAGSRNVRIRVVNKTDAKEAEKIVDSVLVRYPDALRAATQIELLKYHNATEFRRHAGGPTELPDSYSETPVAGSNRGIMLWGIYEEWPPGKYLVVYRVQALSEVAGNNVCFLDVCRSGHTIGQHRPADSEFEKGQWRDMPVILDLKSPTVIEYRLWPQSHVIAIDRLYVFRLL